MVQYIISASNQIDNSTFQTIESFVDQCPTFFQITLDNENQLKQLLDLLKIKDSITTKLIDKDYSTLIEISSQKLPEMNEEKYNQFYEEWLKNTGRENTMDEYAQFIFLQGTSKVFNLAKHRFLLKEA
jgi:hypothetical protein